MFITGHFLNQVAKTGIGMNLLIYQLSKSSFFSMYLFVCCILESCADSDAEVTEVTTPDIIPDHLWNVFPPAGRYLREVMEFCGYQTREDIIRLKSDDEVDKMFQFAIEMHDSVSDDEKMKIFGVFYTNPTKLRILPGLKSTFESFIKSVEGKPASKHPTTKTSFLKRKSFPGPRNLKKEKVNKIVAVQSTVNDVRSRMSKWLLKKCKEKAVTFEISTQENEKSGFLYKCLACKWRTNIPLDMEGKVCLSNAQKHYRINRHCSSQCENFQKKILSDPKTGEGIEKFLAKNGRERSVDANLVEFSRQLQDGDDAWVDDGQDNDTDIFDIDHENVFNNNAADKNTIEDSIASDNEISAESKVDSRNASKNGGAPAGGIQGNTEPSRRC